MPSGIRGAEMYLIIDLEATCWERSEGRRGENEIIEIGAVVVDDDFEVLGESQRFVRPVRNPVLSEFCKRLTSIAQSDVDTARTFPEALRDFQNRVERISGQRLSDMVFCSWGDYDRKQLMRDCRYHGVPYPFGIHRNVKREFARRHHIKPVGIPKALGILGISFEGSHHRGIDDARNITKVFRYEWKGNLDSAM
jgi:inhibitor of KinA sporulation pathway (predicted exonuclease)